MFEIHRRVLGSALAVPLLVTSLALASFVGTGSSEVAFRAKGPAGLTINGASHQLTTRTKDGKLLLVAPLAPLKTGIGLRDHHLRKYLETAKYPEARLEVALSSLKLPEDGKTSQGAFSGKLKLHGVEKPLAVKYRLQRSGSRYEAQGLARLDIRDFEIEVPCYLGVCVDPEVNLKVKFSMKKQ